MNFLQEPHFWSAIAFVLFFIIFGKKIWHPLASILDNRTKQVKNELEEASRLRQEAEKIYASARKEQEIAQAQAQRMLEESKHAAQSIAENAQKEAEASAKRQEELARLRLKIYEQDAVNAVRQEIANIAIKTSYEVIKTILTKDKNNDLVNKAIDDLPKLLTSTHNAA